MEDNLTPPPLCFLRIEIVISKFLESHSKAKRRAPAYSQALNVQ